MSARRIARALALLTIAAAPALLFARNAPAGPPGPWVFIPPPGGSSTAAKPTATTTVATIVPPAGSSSSTATTKTDGMTRANHATVILQRNKKPIGLGVLLSERAVILTARSPVVALGTGDLEAVYQDGTTTKVKLVHEDDAWDLALLVPTSSKGIEGAIAAPTDPLSSSETFSTFVLLKTGKLQAESAAVLGKRDYVSPDGDVLKDALSLDPKSLAIGTPLVDSSGGVVAMVTRACARGLPKPPTIGGKGTCVPALFGVPLSEVRAFLKSAPASAKAPSAYLGIEGTSDTMGVKVTAVKAGSPAAAAGLKSDVASPDVIVAIDGAVVRSIDELHDKVTKHAPGDVVTLLVAQKGAVRDVKVTLKAEGDDAPPAATGKPSASTASTIITLPPLPPLVPGAKK